MRGLLRKSVRWGLAGVVLGAVPCIAACSALLGLERGHPVELAALDSAADATDDAVIQDDDSSSGCAGCVVVARGVPLVTDLATDGTSLFWLSGASVQQCSALGCDTPKTLATYPQTLLHLRYNAGTLAWFSPFGSELWTFAVGADAPVSQRTFTGTATGIALRDGVLAWSQSDSRIRRCDVGACGATTVDLTKASAVPSHLFWASGYLVWGESGNGIAGCPNAKTASNCNGTTTGAPSFVSDASEAVVLDADATNLFWVDVGGALKTVPSKLDSPNQAPKVLARGLLSATRLIVDGGFAYLATAEQIVRVDTSGSAQPEVVSRVAALTSMAMDAQFLYAAESNHATIVRMPRPL